MERGNGAARGPPSYVRGSSAPVTLHSRPTMNRHLPRSATLIAPLLCLPFALGLSTAADKLSFHPEAGSSLEKTISSKKMPTIHVNSLGNV